MPATQLPVSMAGSPFDSRRGSGTRRAGKPAGKRVPERNTKDRPEHWECHAERDPASPAAQAGKARCGPDRSGPIRQRPATGCEASRCEDPRCGALQCENGRLGGRVERGMRPTD